MGLPGRYPGGKTKLRSEISSRISPEWESLEYREPFWGGGGVGLKILEMHPGFRRVWINDLDVGIACLWTSVLTNPEALKSKVMEFVPSIDAFYEFREDLLSAKLPKDSERTAEIGFRKLAIHQISYSGLGTKSGSPLGGVSQNSPYKIDCRWSPGYICKQIDKIVVQFSGLSVHRNRCTSLDFESVIKEEKIKAALFIDPPYYVKGGDLYQHGFKEEDHRRLATLLRNTAHEWVLCYDDCEEVRQLYQWAKIETVAVNYSITALKDKATGQRLARSKNELLITKR